jgi:hypothetical protein
LHENGEAGELAEETGLRTDVGGKMTDAEIPTVRRSAVIQ